MSLFCLTDNTFWALGNYIHSEIKRLFSFVPTENCKLPLGLQSPSSMPPNSLPPRRAWVSVIQVCWRQCPQRGSCSCTPSPPLPLPVILPPSLPPSFSLVLSFVDQFTFFISTSQTTPLLRAFQLLLINMRFATSS